MSRKKERITEFGVYDAKSFSMINSLTNLSRSGEYSPFQINLLQIVSRMRMTMKKILQDVLSSVLGKMCIILKLSKES